MARRTGSSMLATIGAVAALVGAGVGGYVTYSKVMGGCGACCGDKAEPAIVTTAMDDSAPLPACCAGEKAVDDAAAVQTVATESTEEAASGCCQQKAAAECCKSKGKECVPSECSKHAEEEKSETSSTEAGKAPSEG